MVRRVPPTSSREIVFIFPTFRIHFVLSEVYLNVIDNIIYQRG